MTLATPESFSPVVRSEYLDRLVALPPESVDTPVSWISLHVEIQEQFDLLEADIRKRLPAVRVSSGRTAGEQFHLFSYRTFSIPGSALDPVVVGMTFTSAGEGVMVDADASGEQSGDCIASVLSKTAAESKDELLAIARDLARNLRQSAQAIAAALTDPSRTEI